MKKLSSAIVGLGQVGFQLSTDAKRQGVWTHYQAYLALPRLYNLVAICDTDPIRCRTVQNLNPNLRAYPSLEELLNHEDIDVLSLCTPADLHLTQIKSASAKVKGIICEKPLSLIDDEVPNVIHYCAETQCLVMINYYKRFDGFVPSLRGMLEKQALGSIQQITALFTGGIDAVGSHMIDLIWHLFGPITFDKVKIPEKQFQLQFKTHMGALGTLIKPGDRRDLIFELDVIGEYGRLRLLDNCAKLDSYFFRDSYRYDGYRELSLTPVDTMGYSERFLPLFREMYDGLVGFRDSFTTEVKSTIASQHYLSQVLRQASII